MHTVLFCAHRFVLRTPPCSVRTALFCAHRLVLCAPSCSSTLVVLFVTWHVTLHRTCRHITLSTLHRLSVHLHCAVIRQYFYTQLSSYTDLEFLKIYTHFTAMNIEANLCQLVFCLSTWYDMIWYDMIWYDMIWYDMIYLTAVGLKPGGSSSYSTHLHTNNTQNNTIQ